MSMQLERVADAVVLRMQAGKANAIGPAWVSRMATLLDAALAGDHRVPGFRQRRPGSSLARRAWRGADGLVRAGLLAHHAARVRAAAPGGGRRERPRHRRRLRAGAAGRRPDW